MCAQLCVNNVGVKSKRRSRDFRRRTPTCLSLFFPNLPLVFDPWACRVFSVSSNWGSELWVFFILLHNLLRTKMQGHIVAQWTEKFNLQDFVKYIGKYTHTHTRSTTQFLHNASSWLCLNSLVFLSAERLTEECLSTSLWDKSMGLFLHLLSLAWRAAV